MIKATLTIILTLTLKDDVTPVERDHTGGQEMSWEALRMVWSGVKEAGAEKTSWNNCSITLSSGRQVRMFTTLSFIFLLFPNVK